MVGVILPTTHGEALELVFLAPAGNFSVDFSDREVLVVDASTPAPPKLVGLPTVVGLEEANQQSLTFPDGTYHFVIAAMNRDGEVAATIRRHDEQDRDLVQQVVWPADGRSRPPVVLPSVVNIPEKALVRVIGVRSSRIIGQIVTPMSSDPRDDDGGSLVIWEKEEDGTWSQPSIFHDLKESHVIDGIEQSFGGDFPEVTKDMVSIDNETTIYCGDPNDPFNFGAFLTVSSPEGERTVDLQMLLEAAKSDSGPGPIQHVKKLTGAVAISATDTEGEILVLCNGLSSDNEFVPGLYRIKLYTEELGTTPPA